MPPLSLLLLHEIFPSFPPLWEFLVAGLVVGAAITAIVGRQGRPTTTGLSPTGREILGVPWTIPAYALLVVLAGGALSLVVPVASFIIAPGYMLMFILLFNVSALDHGPELIPYLIIVAGSWAFWALCAGVVWRLTQGPRGDAARRGGPARLDIGRRRS